ncbi:hypothetical protein AHAS_Ahas14G0127000 [Arachis hypogaea]
MKAEAEPKEEPTTEELKENTAQDEIGSVTTHAPMKMKDPENQPSLNVQRETEDQKLT